MKWAGVLLAVALVAAIMVARFAGAGVDGPAPDCGLECANAVSAAVWDALHTVDCDDGYDVTDTTCNDDLEYVNSYPPIDSVEPQPDGNIVVELRLLERTRLFDAWRDTVSPNGTVVKAVETTRYSG